MDLPTALSTLVQIHAYFPFLEGQAKDYPRSFRAHIAAMLNQYCAAFFPPGINRMAVAYSANTPRSGKSLLAKMGIIAVHGWPEAMTIPMSATAKGTPRVDETELRKVIDTAIATGSPYLFFDNVRGHVESPALEALLTIPVWSGRVMGSNTKKFRAENNITLVITGNDLNVGPDLRNRFLFCDLFVAEAEASARVVPNPIEDAWVNANRATILECLDTLVRHWDAKGRPGKTGRVRPGFETWCHTIGGIIEAAGMGDILEEAKQAAAGSREEQHARSMAHAIAAQLTLAQPEKEYRPGDLANLCYRNAWFDHQLEGREETSEVDEGKITIKLTPAAKSKFGWTLKKWAPEHKGRTWELGPGLIIRLTSRGEGHDKRIIATLEASPRGRITQLMREHEWNYGQTLTLPDINSMLTGSYDPPDLDQLTPDQLHDLESQWYLIAGHFRAQSAAE